MTDATTPSTDPKPVVVPPPAPASAVVAPVAKVDDPKPADAPEPKGKTPAARLDAIEARLAYLTALLGWPTEEHDERLAEKAKAEQVDFAGNPVKAA